MRWSYFSMVVILVHSAIRISFCAEQGVLFSDDFKRGNDKWEVVSGNWDVENGEYAGSGDGESVSGDEGWKDYVYEVRMKTTESGEKSWNVGIVLFRYMDSNNRYFVLLHTNKMLEFGKRQDGQHKPGLKTVPSVADPKQWNTIRVECKKDNIKIYVNGELKIDYTDPDPILEGKIGFWENGNSTCHYDDVKVWEYGKAPALKTSASAPMVQEKKPEARKLTGNEIIINLTKDGKTGEKYLGDGWWTLEPDACWTGKDKKDAQIIFPVEDGKTYSVVINILTYSFKYKKEGEVVISAEDKKLKTITSDSQENLVEIKIPSELTKGKNKVTLTIKSPFFVPQELGIGADNRTLGMKIKEITIIQK